MNYLQSIKLLKDVETIKALHLKLRSKNVFLFKMRCIVSALQDFLKLNYHKGGNKI